MSNRYSDDRQTGGAAAWAMLGIITFACFFGGLVIGLLFGK